MQRRCQDSIELSSTKATCQRQGRLPSDWCHLKIRFSKKTTKDVNKFQDIFVIVAEQLCFVPAISITLLTYHLQVWSVKSMLELIDVPSSVLSTTEGLIHNLAWTKVDSKSHILQSCKDSHWAFYGGEKKQFNHSFVTMVHPLNPSGWSSREPALWIAGRSTVPKPKSSCGPSWQSLQRNIFEERISLRSLSIYHQ